MSGQCKREKLRPRGHEGEVKAQGRQEEEMNSVHDGNDVSN